MIPVSIVRVQTDLNLAEQGKSAIGIVTVRTASGKEFDLVGSVADCFEIVNDSAREGEQVTPPAAAEFVPPPAPTPGPPQRGLWGATPAAPMQNVPHDPLEEQA